MTVPRGTMQDVLDWVGDDPGRAQEALDAERAGQNRSTLISQLEATCPREDNTVTESDPGAPESDPGVPGTEPESDPGTETVEPGTGEPVVPGSEPETEEDDADTESDEAGADTSVLDTDAGAADRDSDEEQLIGQEAPPQPEEVELNPSDEGTTVFATVPRSRDVELPDEPVFGFPRPVATGPTTTGTVRVGMFDREVSDEEIDGEPIGGAQVEYLDGATNGAALALAFNGEVYLLDPQMAAALKGITDKAIAGMAL